MKIPKLYETDRTPTKEKLIYVLWTHGAFFWLVAEESDDMIFCYANLADDQNAEWGYSSIEELTENGAIRTELVTPVKFPTMLDQCLKARERNYGF